MEQTTSPARESAPLFNHIVERHYRPVYDRLRLILMFLMCIKLSDSTSDFGALVQTISGFSTVAFYIFSGYLVLRKSPNRPQRILRTIRRSAVVFAALAVFYFIVNFFYYRHIGADLASDLTGRRVWFDFLVLNLWPLKIGSAIWYVQAYLYAYVILYFLEKWKLLRYDWLIASVLLVFTVMTGELSGVIKWNILGHSYLPGCFLTRALPYILLGRFMRRNMYILDNILLRHCILGIVCGIALMTIELYLLGILNVAGYYGHLIGMALTAFSVCLIAFQNADNEKMLFESGRFIALSRWHINSIYYLFQPVSLLLTLLNGSSYKAIGLATFLVCFVIGLPISLFGDDKKRR